VRKLLNELKEYVKLPKLLIVVFLVFVVRLVAEIKFDLELKRGGMA
tara:strand:+ start:388 stop:525 length:138 start_codon:yes stop_codon:yes gene_type:complete